MNEKERKEVLDYLNGDEAYWVENGERLVEVVDMCGGRFLLTENGEVCGLTNNAEEATLFLSTGVYKPTVFESGIGVYVSAVYVDENHYYTTSNMGEDDGVLTYYDRRKENEDYIREDDQFPVAYAEWVVTSDEFTEEERMIYGILHSALVAEGLM